MTARAFRYGLKRHGSDSRCSQDAQTDREHPHFLTNACVRGSLKYIGGDPRCVGTCVVTDCTYVYRAAIDLLIVCDIVRCRELFAQYEYEYRTVRVRADLQIDSDDGSSI